MRKIKQDSEQDGSFRSARQLRKSCARLLAFVKKQNVPVWLYEERYLITVWANRILSELPNRTPLPYAVNAAGEEVPFAFLISDAIAPDANAEDIKATLEQSHVNEAFLRLFPIMRAAAVLYRMEKCKREASAPPMLGQWLLQLHKTNALEWSDIHDAVSIVEKTLLCDPSGMYGKSTKESRTAYRFAVQRMAKHYHITEEAAAKEALALAQKAEQPDTKNIAAWLFSEPDTKRGVWLHIGLYLAALLLDAGVFLVLLPHGVWISLVCSFLLLLPLYGLLREGADIAAGYLARKYGTSVPLLQLDINSIPEEGRSLVVITTLLCGGAQDQTIFDNLERFYLRNRDDRVFFGVLADLPSADTEHTDRDAAILCSANNRIAALKERYGDHFLLLVRKRQYAAGETVYMGWERKRGAVLTLVRFLRGHVDDNAFLCAVTPELPLLRCVQYVCTLDADTQLPPDAVREMVSVLLHPYNQPKIRSGCVVHGCAMLQPEIAVTLQSAAATPFSRLCTGRGGVDPYRGGDTDGEALLYGKGSFCGKGMFSVDAFLSVIDCAFPENAVLSHDFLEGALLGVRNLHTVTLEDSHPKHVLSYYERQSRWVRGDTQALRFCFSHYRNADGVRIRNPIPLSDRLRGIDHVIYAWMPAAMVRCALIASFLPLGTIGALLLWLAAFSARLLRPVLLLFRKSAWRGFFRCFWGNVLSDFSQSFLWLGFRIQFAAYEAWVNLRAFCTALWRMLVTHRHMLAWLTAGEAEQKKRADSLGGYYSVFRVSVFLGILLLFSPVFFVKFIGILWMLAPLCAYRLKHDPESGASVEDTVRLMQSRFENDAALPEIRRYFADMWQYFSDHVNKKSHNLPPDNVQWFPLSEERLAHRTSPTNIGLYLCACVAACDFGLISPKTLAIRLSNTLAVLKTMQTYRGHFYNWYNTETAEVLGEHFVSSVDSGNLACALLCCAGGASEYAPLEASLRSIADACTALANRMDFSFLYRSDKEGLAIGYDVTNERLSDGWYDLYASEARSAVYFAIAAGQIPARAWNRLARPVTSSERHLGILSWTGSAFEYFMPALWLPTDEASLSAEMLAFAAHAQYDARIMLHDTAGAFYVFGKSEGGYFAFDADKIFQYQPCGTASLAICRNMDQEQLVMPYALFFMLPFAYRDIPVMETLKRLCACGMYGKYGFYEALDLTKERVGGGWAIVRSVMAHHLGMSIISLANAAFHGIFVKRFLSDPRMEAMRILLWERIPTEAAAYQPNPAQFSDTHPVRYQALGTPSRVIHEGEDNSFETFSVLSNTRTYVIASSMGDIRIFDGQTAIISENRENSALPFRVFLRAVESQNIYVPFACALDDSERQQSDIRFSFLCTDDEIRYTAEYPDGYRAELKLGVSPTGSAVSFSVSLYAGARPSAFDLILFFRPVFYPLKAYTVHKTFADLFLSSRWDAEKKQLYLTRRARGEDERDRTMVISAGGMTDIRAVTDAGALLEVGYTAEDVRRLGAFGALPEENAALKGSAVVPIVYLRGRAQEKTVLHLALGDPALCCMDYEQLSDIRTQHRMLCGGISPMDETVSVMLHALCCQNRTNLLSPFLTEAYQKGERSAVGRERFWQFGISGDHPIYVVCVDEREGDSALHRLHMVLNAWKYLLIAGIRTDLVIVSDESDAYAQPLAKAERKQIDMTGLSFFVGRGLYCVKTADARRNGIFLSAAHVFSADHMEIDTKCEKMPVYPVSRSTSVTSYRMTDQHILIEKGIQKAPWSYFLSNSVMGTMVTLNTLGFTFFTNARECRVTPWFGEALSEQSGELLYLRIGADTRWYDLCKTAHLVMITPYEVHYLGCVGGISFRVSVSIPDRRKRKRMRVFLKNDGAGVCECSLRYQIEPLLGVQREDREAVLWEWHTGNEDGSLVCRSLTNTVCSPYEARISFSGLTEQTGGSFADAWVYCEGKIRIDADESKAADAVLAILRHGEREIPDTLARLPYRPNLTPVLNTGYASLDPLANTWLPLQIIEVRMFARCGYYQPGGAYGFRDQLQDAMAAGMIDASLLKTQIFRAAAHQYSEGDVQHWWHPEALSDPGKSHRGIRSRCSDDYLWLPLAAARYLALTGDASVFDVNIHYLESAPLAAGEHERYETPLLSSYKESVYMHCIRAIEHGFRFGIHGLPLIGSGDWNDGMNRVGIGGSGESVWGGMFFMLVLHAFLPICRSRGDMDGAKRYEETIKKLACAIESDAWNGQWYRRAWYDDGVSIGNPGDACAEIDLLVQSFAAIVNHKVRLSSGARPFDEERVHHAMLCAYSRLFDEEHEVFALLSPPFVRSAGQHDPGYIAGYIPGTRENGGQYTHAAVWGAMGLFAVGETEKGMRVLRALSPVRHTASPEGILRYQKEPYALCGDVLMTPGREGEGGWSQYTGSAAWYYRLLREVFTDRHPGGV